MCCVSWNEAATRRTTASQGSMTTPSNCPPSAPSHHHHCCCCCCCSPLRAICLADAAAFPAHSSSYPSCAKTFWHHRHHRHCRRHHCRRHHCRCCCRCCPSCCSCCCCRFPSHCCCCCTCRCYCRCCCCPRCCHCSPHASLDSSLSSTSWTLKTPRDPECCLRSRRLKALCSSTSSNYSTWSQTQSFAIPAPS